MRHEHLMALEGRPSLLAGVELNAIDEPLSKDLENQRYFDDTKGREGSSLPGGWRPISLGSVLARLFSGVMRSYVQLSPRQVGFVEGNGNFANVRALHEALRIGKKRQVVGQVLDVSKALTVSRMTP